MLTAVVVIRMSASISDSVSNHVISCGFKYPINAAAKYSKISARDTQSASFPLSISTVKRTAKINIEGIPPLYPPDTKNSTGKKIIKIVTIVIRYAVWYFPVLYVNTNSPTESAASRALMITLKYIDVIMFNINVAILIHTPATARILNSRMRSSSFPSKKHFAKFFIVFFNSFSPCYNKR